MAELRPTSAPRFPYLFLFTRICIWAALTRPKPKLLTAIIPNTAAIANTASPTLFVSLKVASASAETESAICWKGAMKSSSTCTKDCSRDVEEIISTTATCVACTVGVAFGRTASSEVCSAGVGVAAGPSWGRVGASVFVGDGSRVAVNEGLGVGDRVAVGRGVRVRVAVGRRVCEGLADGLTVGNAPVMFAATPAPTVMESLLVTIRPRASRYLT